MENFITPLISLIREEEGLLNAFLELLEEQKGYLIKNDFERFEESVERQEELIEAIKTLEASRFKQVGLIAADKGIAESEISLTRLVEMSLGQVSLDLADAKKSINFLVSRIQRANEVNRYLIKRSLNISQKKLDWLIDGGTPTVIYQPNGQIKERESRPVLLNRTM